jgi:hypothetical protein
MNGYKVVPLCSYELNALIQFARDNGLTLLRSGVRVWAGPDAADYNSTAFAYFKAAPQQRSYEEARAHARELRRELPWSYDYNGPGQAYADRPCVQVSSSRVLVTQSSGLDI